MLRRSSLSLNSKILFLVSLVAFLASCGGSGSSEESAVRFRLPWPGENGGEYALRTVEVKTLIEPEKLKGKAATVLVSPEYRSDVGLKDGDPNFRFFATDQFLVAADSLSLQAATVYAHIERLQEMDRAVGVDKEVGVGQKVGIETRWRTSGREDILINNALYDGRTESMIIVPYESDGLPISVNAGVIAHEYAHRIFNILVRKPLLEARPSFRSFSPGGHFDDPLTMKPVFDLSAGLLRLAPEKRKLTRERFNWDFALRAVDEGLADYWGWVYTGDNVFMGRSLTNHHQRRRLDESPGRIRSLSFWRTSSIEEFLKKRSLVSLAYRQGTDYARFFRQLTHSMGLANSYESRVEAARRLVPAMKRYREAALEQSKKGYLSPDLILTSYLEANSDLAAEHCSFFQQTVSRDGVVSIKGCSSP